MSSSFKSSRGRSGAAAAARVNQRYFLRAVVGHVPSPHGTSGLVYELLECGHTQLPKHDMIGQTYAARRRCKSCPKPECPTCEGRGYPVVVRNGVTYKDGVCPGCKGRGVNDE